MVIGCADLSFGQQSVLDGVYTKSINNANRKPIAYVQLREADILWAKRVWRQVDMMEKMNQVFYYPPEPTQGRKNFMTVLMEGITETGNITAYNPGPLGDNDMFSEPMTSQEVDSAMVKIESVKKIDEITFEEYTEEVTSPIELKSVSRFEIKEEVFFDKQRSVIEYRILGIAPLFEKYRGLEFEGYEKKFWIYFPEARAVLAQNEIYNRHNDVQRLTYDDIFLKRMFTSTIIKESNVYDRKIERYKSPLDALLEAERIKEEVFNFEHDLWSY